MTMTVGKKQNKNVKDENNTEETSNHKKDLTFRYFRMRKHRL